MKIIAIALALLSFTVSAAVTFEPDRADVVIAADAVDSVVWAAEEATNFLSRVLGKPVPVVTAPREGRAALVLGVNAWSRTAGLDPMKYPYDSFLIRTGTDRVFIAGVDEKGDVYRRLKGGNSLECFQRGTALGLYAFLERFAGCRFYFPGELGEIVPRQDRIVVPETDLVSTPANLIRRYYPKDGEIEPEMNVSAGYNVKTLNWMRLRMATASLTCCHGTIKFNFMERFAKTHPEYFAQNPDGTRCNVFTGSASSKHGQLCFSHPEVREIIYQECLKRFRAGATFVDIMPNDGYPGCFCERCCNVAKPERGVYGRDTPIIWDCTADIARRLKAAGVSGRVTQMAYSSYSDVSDVELPDNVAVMVATRGPWALVDEATMAGDVKKVRDWGTKTGGSVWIWTYPHKYKETNIKGVPDVAPKAWGNYYKAMKGLIFGTFAESESDRSIYHYLNYYVFSRVMWDVDTDVDAVLDEHYRLMFGSAADEMKAFYELLEEKWTRGIAGNVMDTDVGPVMSAPTEHDLWTKVYSPAARTEMDRLLAKAAAKVASDSIEGRRIAFFRRCYFDGLAEGAAAWQAKTDAAAACRWNPASGEKISLSWYAGDKASADRVRTEIALRREGDDYVFTFDCEEPEMDDLAVLDREHDDPDTWKDSGVEFRICPNGDRMHYYHLVVNAKGCILDSKGYKPGRTRWVGWSDRKWESGATARVTTRADGWTTELRVPVAAFGETVRDVPMEFLRSRKLKSGKGVGYYKWGRVSSDLGQYEFYGTVRLPSVDADAKVCWKPGHYQVHYIFTGRGESMFHIFPDGTSMLLDVGDSMRFYGTEKETPHLPDLSRRSGEWVARYVERVNPKGRKVDYFHLSHYHEDHGGGERYHGERIPAPTGDYYRCGLGDAMRFLEFGKVVDRAWPTFDDPVDVLATSRDGTPRNIKAVYAALQARGTAIERFQLGSRTQFRQLDAKAARPGFEVFNLCSNGRYVRKDGSVRDLYADRVKKGERTLNENGMSCGMIVSYGKFRYFTAGDFSDGWRDSAGNVHRTENALAEAVGPVDVAKISHHGYHSMYPELVKALQARVWTACVLDQQHCTDDTMMRLDDRNAYPGERLFLPTYMPLKRPETEFGRSFLAHVAPEVIAEPCHVVLDVEEGGDRYSLTCIAAATETPRVRARYDFVSKGECGLKDAQ